MTELSLHGTCSPSHSELSQFLAGGELRSGANPHGLRYIPKKATLRAKIFMPHMPTSLGMSQKRYSWPKAKQQSAN